MENQSIKVEVNHLCKQFNNLKVLDDCSFTVKEGEFVCVVGPTGCGKTTFLNLLANLIEPTSGEVLIDGTKTDARKHNISFIFQEPSAFPWLTVQKNLEFGLKAKNKDKQQIDKRVSRVMDLMGLKKYKNSYPSELSSSTEQKIVIGRAFVTEPDLLLMDEPYGQMDLKMRFYLEDEVIRIWNELKTTVLFITHNIEEAVYLAERVLILSNKPASVKEEVIVDMPHPRDVNDPEFIRIRNYITNQIKWW